MTILTTFREAATARGLLAADEPLRPDRAFELVREMPYARASDGRVETVVGEWRGTCSGKHILLRELYEESGLRCLLMCATHSFTLANTPWLPPHLREMVEDHPVPDVHNFVRLEVTPDEWMVVDATWPVAAGALGMPVNERFEAGRNMRLACDPDELFHVPPEADPRDFKAMLLERHVGEQAERRDCFIEGLSAWLAEALPEQA